MSAENAWKVAMEAAANVAECIIRPNGAFQDIVTDAWNGACYTIIADCKEVPMPTAFRAAVEAETEELRGMLAEAVAAWPAALRIIREYDESFPYAEKEGDDEAVTRMRRAIETLRERIGAMEPTAALLLAEIERLDRLEAKEESHE